jgi:hypothetical protein
VNRTTTVERKYRRARNLLKKEGRENRSILEELMTKVDKLELRTTRMRSEHIAQIAHMRSEHAIQMFALNKRVSVLEKTIEPLLSLVGNELAMLLKKRDFPRSLSYQDGQATSATNVRIPGTWSAQLSDHQRLFNTSVPMGESLTNSQTIFAQ